MLPRHAFFSSTSGFFEFFFLFFFFFFFPFFFFLPPFLNLSKISHTFLSALQMKFLLVIALFFVQVTLGQTNPRCCCFGPSGGSTCTPEVDSGLCEKAGGQCQTDAPTKAPTNVPTSAPTTRAPTAAPPTPVPPTPIPPTPIPPTPPVPTASVEFFFFLSFSFFFFFFFFLSKKKKKKKKKKTRTEKKKSSFSSHSFSAFRSLLLQRPPFSQRSMHAQCPRRAVHQGRGQLRCRAHDRAAHPSSAGHLLLHSVRLAAAQRVH